jgi:predicted transcriptional regulator
MTVINVRLEDEVKDALDLLAKELDLPPTQLAARAIAEYVQRNVWQIAAIKEAIGQLDAGHSYDFDEVLEELDGIITQEEKARHLRRSGQATPDDGATAFC